MKRPVPFTRGRFYEIKEINGRKAVKRMINEAGHVLLRGKRSGRCSELTGEVGVRIVFVCAEKKQDEIRKQAFRRAIGEALEYLTGEAARAGVRLSFRTSEEETDAAGIDLTDGNGQLAGFAEKRLSRTSAAGNARKKEATIFCLPVQGRSFARKSEGGGTDEDEFACVYVPDLFTVLHEFLHLFGAVDFYYPRSVEEAAAEYLSDSVMLTNGSKTVDAATRYLIGWDRVPSAQAERFFDATASLTADQIRQALTAQWSSGRTEVKNREYSYSGDMKNGLFDGHGRLVYRMGDTYEGEFRMGKCQGKGVYSFRNGALYAGEFADGKHEGRGTLVYTDGTVYTGDFADGKSSGRGTLVYTDGTVYTGDFADGKRNGQGTLLYRNGAVYVGGFENGECSGHGILTFPDGSVQKGVYRNGKYVGPS